MPTCSFCETETSEPLTNGICDSCLDNTTLCEHCNTRIPSDEAFYVSYPDIHVCESCWDDHYFQCRHCGDSFPNSNYAADGLCHYCYDEEDEGDEGEPMDGDMEPLHGTNAPGFPSHILCGLELEFFYPNSCTSMEAFLPYGSLKHDGSINPDAGYCSIEFASRPASGTSLVSLVESVWRLLRSKRCEVNDSCGLHLHISMSDFASPARDNILKWWRIYEPIFFGLMEPARKISTYCAATGDTPDTSLRNDRYRALNIAALHKHSTYELRLHHATLDKTEVLNFIRLSLAFFTFAAKTEITEDKLKAFESMSERKFLHSFLASTSLPYSCNKHLITRLKKYEPLWLERKRSN